MKNFKQFINEMILHYGTEEELFNKLSHLNELEIKFDFIHYKKHIFLFYKNNIIFTITIADNNLGKLLFYHKIISDNIKNSEQYIKKCFHDHTINAIIIDNDTQYILNLIKHFNFNT